MSCFRNIFSHFALNAIVLMFIILYLLFGCEKFEPIRTIIVRTDSVTNVSYTSCTAHGMILDKDEKGINQHGFCFLTQQKPTTEDNKIQLGSKSSTGGFIVNLTGLSANTTYYMRAYATNSAGTVYGSQVSFTTIGPVTDIDGNIYNTVTIGTQVWMVENLKTTKYNDGTGIPLVTNTIEWSNLTTPGYCWYNNDEASYKNTYGALYNWYTVNTGKLCPTGWHVPTNAEWTTLTDYLGGAGVAGGKLKEAGTTHWNSPNTGATNESGFTALPGGRRYTTGLFYFFGETGCWWSSTKAYTSDAYSRKMYYNDNDVLTYDDYWNHGFSVRCVRD